MIQLRATQKVVLEAGSEIAALSLVAAAVAAAALSLVAAAGITILQKAAALVILPQSQRIYLGHLLRTAAAGKYNSQNL